MPNQSPQPDKRDASMPAALPVIHTTDILPEWLDYNDHLNVAYYILIFDQAGEAVIRSLGMGEAVTRQTGLSWVVLENHAVYLREVILGQTVEVRLQLLDHDEKRLHVYLEMLVPGPEGYLAATLEQMLMCVDLRSRRAARFPDEVRAAVVNLASRQSSLKKPSVVGRRIGIRR